MAEEDSGDFEEEMNRLEKAVSVPHLIGISGSEMDFSDISSSHIGNESTDAPNSPLSFAGLVNSLVPPPVPRASSSQTVKVAVNVRPLIAHEIASRCQESVSVLPGGRPEVCIFMVEGKPLHK